MKVKSLPSVAAITPGPASPCTPSPLLKDLLVTPAPYRIQIWLTPFWLKFVLELQELQQGV